MSMVSSNFSITCRARAGGQVPRRARGRSAGARANLFSLGHPAARAAVGPNLSITCRRPRRGDGRRGRRFFFSGGRRREGGQSPLSEASQPAASGGPGRATAAGADARNWQLRLPGRLCRPPARNARGARVVVGRGGDAGGGPNLHGLDARRRVEHRLTS